MSSGEIKINPSVHYNLYNENEQMTIGELSPCEEGESPYVNKADKDSLAHQVSGVSLKQFNNNNFS